MRYKYFISYSHIRGFGNCEITTISKIKDMDDINSIQKEIELQKGFKGVIILNYKLFNTIH